MKLSDLHVKKVKRSVGRDFIIEHHYSGSCSATAMTWGLYQNETLVGMIAFATPISENVRRYIWKDRCEEDMKNYTTELHRLVTLDRTPHNTETWFISRALNALKEYKPKYKAVLSHADQEEGHDGTIYQASNAIYTGTTGSKRAYYERPDGSLTTPRISGENITVAEAETRGWKKVSRARKHRYVFLLPDPYESKDEIKTKIGVEEIEYP